MTPGALVRRWALPQRRATASGPDWLSPTSSLPDARRERAGRVFQEVHRPQMPSRKVAPSESHKWLVGLRIASLSSTRARVIGTPIKRSRGGDLLRNPQRMSLPNASVLEGVLVLDAAIYIAAALSAAILSEFGAQVIKIEHPSSGDPLRRFGTRGTDPGASVQWLNESRNKRSVPQIRRRPSRTTWPRRFWQFCRNPPC